MKTLYSQEAVTRCPTIYTGWSVGISNNYICLYHLYLLDQSENILYKLCALVLLGPLCYPTFRSCANLVLGFQTRHGDTNVAFVRPSRTRRHLQGAPPQNGNSTGKNSQYLQMKHVSPPPYLFQGEYFSYFRMCRSATMKFDDQIREVECNNTFHNIHILCCFLMFFSSVFSQALRSSRPKIIVTLAIFRADLSKSDLSFRIYSIKVCENVPYVEFSIPCKRNELHFHASGVSQIPGCCPMCPPSMRAAGPLGIPTHFCVSFALSSAALSPNKKGQLCISPESSLQ